MHSSAVKNPEPVHRLFASPSENVKRVNVLGVGLSVLNLRSALEAITKAIAERRKGYICITGVHGVSEAQADPRFREILNAAFLCTPDGMPMVWMGKLAGHREMDRVYGPDLMALVCESSPARGWRHFLYGGGPGVAGELRSKLQERFPGLQIAGTYTPPFRPLNTEEETELARMVESTRPDFLWVGLSTPKQEKFMAQYLPKLNATLMVGVGAAFDFHSGKIKQAPRWMQRSGLEWFYRLCSEPRRLWKRYLKNNPLFIARVFCQVTGLRRYPLNEP
ncbi:MAG: glycosyltransferase [Pedosphaera sp.]|nr:glycosyltransferase [Pedosphaera sp.]